MLHSWTASLSLLSFFTSFRLFAPRSTFSPFLPSFLSSSLSVLLFSLLPFSPLSVLLIYAPNMHTRLALATIATVKAGTYIPCARRPTTTPGPPASRIRTSHIMESGASATILKERAKRKREKREPEPEVKCTRENPNIDSARN